MAKASTRFRNRKINFKTRISIRTGTNALDFDDDTPNAETVEFDEETKSKSKSASSGGEVETGVDKEEEHELHLQTILSRSSSSKATKAFIPTPDSTGKISTEEFNKLYPENVWNDPMSYIRFSDTVEDAIVGAVGYDMDEDDEEFLESLSQGRGKKNEIGEDEFELLMEFMEKVSEEKSPMAHVVCILVPSLSSSWSRR